MKEDALRYLVESGYLDSPVGRLVWRGASPNLRHHLRRFLILSLFFALPFAGINAALTLLGGGDRLLLGGFYLVGLMALFLALDLLTAVLVRLPGLERWWSGGSVLNLGAALLGGVVLLTAGYFLESAIFYRSINAQVLVWVAMALASWIAARALTFLLVSRLYWHGIRPPQYRKHTILTVTTLLVILGFQLYPRQRGNPGLEPVPAPPMVLLALDVPPAWFDPYAAQIPHQRRDRLQARTRDITDFWTELGTGVRAGAQAASLVSYDTPVFGAGLNRRDPTQRPILAFFELFGVTAPQAEGVRYRKYFWEILDNYGSRTYAFSYWHSFPASSQNGGILSERWSQAHSGPPYSSGIVSATPAFAAPPLGSNADHPSIQRENQGWTQLLQRAAQADFDLCVAYFPLADQLAELGVAPADMDEAQRVLFDFRAGALRSLLERLPQQTLLGVVLASGKGEANRKSIHFEFLSNWPENLAAPFESHLQIAPTVLGLYELPPGRLMTDSRLNSAPDGQKRVDYGEPTRSQSDHHTPDEGYYEELKSLGYVQ